MFAALLIAAVAQQATQQIDSGPPHRLPRTVAIDERLAADARIQLGDRLVLSRAPGGPGDTVIVAPPCGAEPIRRRSRAREYRVRTASGPVAVVDRLRRPRRPLRDRHATVAATADSAIAPNQRRRVRLSGVSVARHRRRDVENVSRRQPISPRDRRHHDRRERRIPALHHAAQGRRAAARRRGVAAHGHFRRLDRSLGDGGGGGRRGAGKWRRRGASGWRVGADHQLALPRRVSNAAARSPSSRPASWRFAVTLSLVLGLVAGFVAAQRLVRVPPLELFERSTRRARSIARRAA